MGRWDEKFGTRLHSQPIKRVCIKCLNLWMSLSPCYNSRFIKWETKVHDTSELKGPYSPNSFSHNFRSLRNLARHIIDNYENPLFDYYIYLDLGYPFIKWWFDYDNWHCYSNEAKHVTFINDMYVMYETMSHFYEVIHFQPKIFTL